MINKTAIIKCPLKIYRKWRFNRCICSDKRSLNNCLASNMVFFPRQLNVEVIQRSAFHAEFFLKLFHCSLSSNKPIMQNDKPVTVLLRSSKYMRGHENARSVLFHLFHPIDKRLNR